jgi:hypothetical protein
MWYVICLGSGLVLGIGFLIWALKERAARQKAEEDASAFRIVSETNVAIATKAQSDVKDLRNQIMSLQAAVRNAQQKLLDCNDPETIKAWLTDELKGLKLG